MDYLFQSASLKREQEQTMQERELASSSNMHLSNRKTPSNCQKR